MKKFDLILTVTLSCGLLFSACFKSEDKNKKSIADAVVIDSIKSDVKWDIVYPAKVTGVQVKAKVSGTLNEILYKEGEHIEKGAPMFVVDKHAYKAAYDRASVVLNKAKQEYGKSKANFTKSKSLYEKKSMKKNDFDAVSAAYKKAETEYKEAQAAMKDAETQLKNTKVTAPISGIAGSSIYPKGTSISAEEGTEILTYISEKGPLKVTFYIPSVEIDNFREGFLRGKIKFDSKIGKGSIPVEALLDNNAVYPETGGIVLFSDKERSERGFVKVEAEFPNPENKKNIIPGEDIKVRIKRAYYTDAVVILKTCLFRTGSETFVFAVRPDNTAETVPVTYATEGDFAFITSGLQGGETVVSYVSGGIESGKPVNPRKIDFLVPERYVAKIVPEPEEEPVTSAAAPAKTKKEVKKTAAAANQKSSSKQNANKKNAPKSGTASQVKK
ncbi:MAG: efflux RND transporter periplasmic adaptor subunit [Endomicrobia bacterium]|nr:efflux RND transporter periplasmic adaptor subunit [Endomicrobiia bacterium]